jgi:purine-binding chemotaxis protein CheW
MNLADIRKKAQNAEVQWGPKPPSAGLPATGDAPEPFEAGEPPELAEMLEQAAASWQPEPAEPLLPAELYDPQPDIFDPAAMILKGRESSAFADDACASETVDAASVELLCFKVASEEYAISIMNIKEIIKPREVTEVPRVPSFVRGILSLRGNIIPIFDMRERLGLAGADPSEHERIVVVKRQNGFCGVLVDEVVQVVRIAEAGIEPPPVVLEGIDREFVQGIGRVNGRMLILLDMEQVLDVSLL